MFQQSKMFQRKYNRALVIPLLWIQPTWVELRELLFEHTQATVFFVIPVLPKEYHTP